MKSKVLEIGPSRVRSKGGMATVLQNIGQDKQLNERFEISFHASYVDGSLPVRLIYSIFAYLKFLIIHRKYHIMHIHTASYGSTFRKRWYEKTALKSGKKVIVHIHGAEYMVFYNNLKDKKKAQVVDFLQKANCVIALSRKWMDLFEKNFSLANCVAINNGVNEEDFLPARIDVADCTGSFVFFGRIGERKGAYDLIKAVKQLTNQGRKLHLVMAGDGEIDKAKRMIAKLGLDSIIDLPGWVGYEDKIRYLSRAAVVILPAYHEGLPMTILEGMAAGKGIISTNVGAISEVVEDGVNGLIINPGDINALSNAMSRLMDDPQLLCRMSSANCYKIKERYSIKIMHDQIAKCFIQVMN